MCVFPNIDAPPRVTLSAPLSKLFESASPVTLIFTDFKRLFTCKRLFTVAFPDISSHSPPQYVLPLIYTPPPPVTTIAPLTGLV